MPSKDPEKRRASRRRYRATHRKQVRAYAAAYRAKNLERHRIWHRRWIAKNPDRVREYNRRASDKRSRDPDFKARRRKYDATYQSKPENRIRARNWRVAWEKANPLELKRKKQAWARRFVERLSDSYVRHLLRLRPGTLVSRELLEAKHAQVMLVRLVRQFIKNGR